MSESLRAAIDDSFRLFFPLFSIGFHLALCAVFSWHCCSVIQWFSDMFDFSEVDSVGALLLKLVFILIHLFLTPGVLICFFFRWFFSLPIGKRGDKK